MARSLADFGYWALVSFCLVIGVLGIFSIGMPLLLLGIALTALARERGKAERFWPPLIGLALFVLGYVLVAPLGCTTSEVTFDNGAGSGVVGSTTCNNLLGIDYSGVGIYNPPLWPALVAATVMGALAFIGARYYLSRKRPSVALDD
jgi:hypothetical protein